MLTHPLPTRFTAPLDDKASWSAGILAEKLQRAAREPVREQIKDICASVFGATMVTEPLANSLRELLRELSNNLNGCHDVERPLRDFELLLRAAALKVIRGES